MFPELFENEKIIFINVVSDRLRFSIDQAHLYNSHTVINCVKIDKLTNATHITARKAIKEGDIILSKQFDLTFLLGVLNSKLINWYFLNFQSEGLHFYPDDAKKLPICKSNENQQIKIKQLVTQILSLKSEGEDTGVLEQEIDYLVYKLYNLTYDEVIVIDPQFSLSRTAYESTPLA